MVNYLELPIGDRSPEVFRSVIEIPKDGTNKFEYDKELHVFQAGPQPALAGPLSRRLWVHPIHPKRRRRPA